MERLSLYKIRDAAVSSGRAVFGISQLCALLGVKRNIAAVYLSRLVNKGLAVRLRRGRISLPGSSELAIATQII